MKQFILRLSHPSPKLFKTITNLCATAAVVGTGIIGIPAAVAGAGIVFVLPAILTKAASYMIVAGAVGGIISKSTVEDPSVIK
jgi:hypothetical protein